MPISIKVINGTRPGDGKSLCTSCRYGKFAKGESESEVHFDCDGFTEAPKFKKITECNQYVNKSLPSMRDMQDLAWILVTDRNRQKIGFQQAKEWRKENQREAIVPDDDY